MIDQGAPMRAVPFGADTGSDPWADYECRSNPPDAIACGDPLELGSDYVYLLGLYLGDGCISKMPRNVWRLRIFQDARYPGLIDACAGAVQSVVGRDPGRIRDEGCIEVYSTWKHWTCLFPQHGVGKKHDRDMSLLTWQQNLVNAYPRDLLIGLILSDGCRVINRIRKPTIDGFKEYRYVRYFFSNASGDILALFSRTCAQVGIDCRPTRDRLISVARRESVQLLDEFIGPKR